MVFASIDIGSNTVKLLIVDVANKKTILQDISENIDIATSAFKLKYIDDSLVEKIIASLNYYKKLMDENGVDHYRAYATSAFREAINSKFIVNKIFRKTGIKIEIIDDSQEKFLTNKSLRDLQQDFKKYRKFGSVVVDFTTGACDISIFNSNKIVRNDELSLGSYKLTRILAKTLESSTNYAKEIESYILVELDYLKNVFNRYKLQNYILVGGVIKDISKLFFNSKKIISKEEFYSFYKRVIKTDSSIIEKVIKEGKNYHEILANLILFKVFLDIFNTDNLNVYPVSLKEGIISELIDEYMPSKRYIEFNEDPYQASINIAKRFFIKVSHIRYVHRVAILVGKELKNKLSFSSKDIRMLRHASILYDIGKAINLNNYLEASCSMIRGMRIYSLSKKEIIRVSNIIKIMGLLIKREKEVFKYNQKDVFIGVIILLANYLNFTREQKVTIKEVKFENDVLILKCNTKKLYQYEKILINDLKEIFNTILGINFELMEIK